MIKCASLALVWGMGLGLAGRGHAAETVPVPIPAALTPTPQAIATFQCVGLYWAPAQGGGSNVACTVRYRKVGETAWRDALPLWFDERNREYRGSIVGLTAGTAYEVEMELAGAVARTALTARTWPENFPVARTVTLSATTQTTPYVISEGGTPDGYVLYTGDPSGKSVIDVGNQQDVCVTVRANYVIVRGLTLKGARRDGLLIDGPVHDVVIERCDISGWGRIASSGFGVNMDGGIRGNSPELMRLIVQRNRIHHPRSNSNDWSQTRTDTRETNPLHPNGPQGIILSESRGNHVIRYNEVTSDEQHRFNDGIGGGENFSFRGFPGPDSDVYGNLVRNVADDALEIEGSGRNIRVWGNYLDQTYIGVATVVVAVGPTYVFRNVLGVSRQNNNPNDPDNRGTFAKTGDTAGYGGGRLYLFHNTMLQPPGPTEGSRPLGARCGIGDWGGPLHNTISRNNIWYVTPENRELWHHTMSSLSICDSAKSGTNDFDYDLYSGTLKGTAGVEAHGTFAVPRFVSNSGFTDATGLGSFALDPASPGYGKALPLANFNSPKSDRGPDPGAHPSGNAPMEFGVNATTMP